MSTYRVVSQYNDQVIDYSQDIANQVDQVRAELCSYHPFQTLVQEAGINPDEIVELSVSRSIKGDLNLTVSTGKEAKTFVVDEDPVDRYIQEAAEFILHPQKRAYPHFPTADAKVPLRSRAASTPPAGQEVLLEAIRELSRAQMKMAEEHRASIEILAKALADRNCQPVQASLPEVVREFANAQIRIVEMLTQNRPAAAANPLQPVTTELREELNRQRENDHKALRVALEQAQKAHAEQIENLERRLLERTQKEKGDEAQQMEIKLTQLTKGLTLSLERTQKEKADQIHQLEERLKEAETQRNRLERLFEDSQAHSEEMRAQVQQLLNSTQHPEPKDEEEPDAFDEAIERVEKRISHLQDLLSDEEISEPTFSEAELFTEAKDEIDELLQRTKERLSRMAETLNNYSRVEESRAAQKELEEEFNALSLPEEKPIQNLSEEELSSPTSSAKSPHCGRDLFAQYD